MLGSRVSLLLILLLASAPTFAGCERGDGEHASASPLRATSRPPDPAPSPSPPSAAKRTPHRCVVPLGAEPSPARPAPDCPPDPTGPPTLPEGRERFVDAPGRPQVDVELARTHAHRSRGLMYRTELGADQGMLFSWNREAPRSFWMENTCIPLDMLFIAADGTIVGILEQVPTLNRAPRRVPCPAAHVLEVNAGWVRAHDVRPGQRIEIDS